MKNLYLTGLLFFWSLLLLFDFSCKPGTKNEEKNRGAAFERDTSAIHSLLKRIAGNEISDKDSSMFLLKKAEELSDHAGYLDGLAQTHFEYGNYYYEVNDYQKALSYYENADSLSQKAGNSLLKARCLERMASVHLDTDDPALALKFYYKSLPLFERNSDKGGLARVYNIIGVYKTEKGIYDSAETLFNKALSYFNDLKDEQWIVNVKGNLADLYERKGQMNNAHSLYRELINNLSRKGERQNLPIVLYNYAALLSRHQKEDTANILIEQALAISESAGDTSLLPELYMAKAEYLIKKHDYSNAHKLYQKALAMAKAIDSPGLSVNIIDDWIHLDTLGKNYWLAMIHLKERKVMQDTLYDRREKNNILLAENQYHAERTNLLLGIRKAELDSLKAHQRIYLFIIVLIICLAFIIIYMINLRRSLLKKRNIILQQEVRIREMELEQAKNEEEIQRLMRKDIEDHLIIKMTEQIGYALALEQKKVLLRQVSDQLDNGLNGSEPITSEKLIQIVSSIKSQEKALNEEDFFNEKFSALYQQFYLQLAQKHPNLTKSELKFCAFLKINLTGNQIANILNVTNEAIRKTRYRIRKKINLQPNESLEGYLSGI